MTTLTAPSRLRQRLALPAAALAVVALVVCSLFVGVYDLRAGDLGAEMLWITRVPRTVALVLAGCAMAVSGLVMQLLTQNRFVEPTTTGTTEWAALGLLVAVLLMPESPLIVRMTFASVAAFAGTLVFLAILRRIRLRSSLIVPLIGIMLGAVVSSFTTYLAVSTNALQMLGTWFLGSFTSVVRGRYEVLWIVGVVVVLVALFANRLTAASLGQDVATTLGVDYDRVLLLGTALVAVATGVTTVVVGFLPFLGLIVPNLISMWRGDNLRANLPWVCLGGVAIIVACDIVGRVIRMPFEVPVSMILGVLGAAVFITLLLRQRAHG
ncbi:ABC transporter permease [Microbacterium imperiale]|uniref:Iron ABC transporter permease n=1 Tax=Microbacterium imperiale TaxID=33884 RepID=A0A9W6HJI2_9MICO|nr:iron chelate uptake ABC transporter family permease subunit [Microbacterium imperiale]MBP2421668.1 iron complex transport system permease protein [Microbacterium imperiale]MDS0199229.1 iron chelate uptake ABC transporter family permease subunit [Microbacterium imperiale]BFE42010.1 iron chelate uptake ABC transporter family permease subunit [Microbacterium imperiale]GLJ80963.1 iron ABC transporter permease [Microbacterium imperiale]